MSYVNNLNEFNKKSPELREQRYRETLAKAKRMGDNHAVEYFSKLLKDLEQRRLS